jgi:hypothetical protein
MGETNETAQLPTSRKQQPLQEDVALGVEKFSATDLMSLRHDLLHSGADSFQAAEIVAAFLTGRGYGISPTEARTVASAIETPGVTPEHIQAELERVARVA